MDSWQLLGEVVLLLAAALAFGLVFERLHLGALVGYLLAGALVGPAALGWIGAESAAIPPVAELGVALLLFTIGLELSPARLRSIGMPGVVLGLSQLVVTIAVTAGVGLGLGVSLPEALVVGAVVAMGSTATVGRILQERGELDSMEGRSALAILVVQDLALLPLLLAVAFAGGGGGVAALVAGLGSTAMRVASLAAVLFLVCAWILPRVLHTTALTRNHELPVVLAVVTCLVAMWLSHAIGLSPAVGALVAGLLLADSPFAGQVRADVAPLRAVFLTLFFASIGMMADLPWLVTGGLLGVVLGLAASIIVGKTILTWGLMRVLGRPNRTAWASGLSVAPIGEFSFVLGAVAVTAGVLEASTFQVFVSASFLTLLMAPLLVGRARSLAGLIERVQRRLGLLRRASPVPETVPWELTDHVVVVGYGPAGRSAVEHLEAAGREVVVIDLSPVTLEDLRAMGRRAVLGNAVRRETLDQAHLSTAHAIVVTLPDYETARGVIAMAKGVAPGVRIVARARYHAHEEGLHRSGAVMVEDEEHGVGHRLGAAALADAAIG